MNIVPGDLHAFGNRTGPRLPRLGINLIPDERGMLAPETPPYVRGASTFADPSQSGFSGHYHRLPAGTILPDGLAIIADGADVDSDSCYPQSHHMIYPTRSMSVQEFVALFQALPWEYGGKR